MTTPDSVNFDDLPSVLKIEEAAAVLRVSTWTLYEEIKRGGLPVGRVGSRGLIRIRKETIRALLAGEAMTRKEPKRAPR